MKHHHPRRSRAGFTLLEMAITGMLFGLILGTAALVSRTGSQAAQYADLSSRVQSKARRALDRIVEELNEASQTQLAPDPGVAGSANFSYRKVAAVSNAGVVTWSNLFRLDLADDSGDPDNGLDDDGDGSVDEKLVRLTIDAGLASQKQVTLVHDVRELMGVETANGADDDGNGLVDEPGFLVTRNGSLLTVRLTTEEFLADGRRATATMQTAVLLRN
ncbi:MAG: hypothetical protein L6Q99_13870 [Planctomycetes bacterium]|nr:hypothetical protein [Planctomycetota bacterium]